jgi:hypothetical protein
VKPPVGRFRGRAVLVTGAAQGIGASTAAAFAAEGARVMLADTNAPFGERRRREIERAGGKAWFVRADAGKVSQVRRMVKEAVRRLGGLDILVNNVGIGSGTGLLQRKPSDWQRVIDTNLGGAYHASQMAAPFLMKARGSIVSIASSRALQSEADTEPYSASKGGILALTHALAVTLSGKVRVNTVLPGWIDTSKWHYDGMKWELTREDHAQHPAGRVGRPEDIAAAVLFLCSDEAGFITGQKLVVDGGMTVKMIYAE